MMKYAMYHVISPYKYRNAANYKVRLVFSAIRSDAF